MSRERMRPDRLAAVLVLMAVSAMSVTSVSSPVMSQERRTQRRAPNSAFTHYYEMAREAFSPERAFGIVAFMDDLWRLPGSPSDSAESRKMATS